MCLLKKCVCNEERPLVESTIMKTKRHLKKYTSNKERAMAAKNEDEGIFEDAHQ